MSARPAHVARALGKDPTHSLSSPLSHIRSFPALTLTQPQRRYFRLELVRFDGTLTKVRRVNPTKALADGGVAERPGHTEAAVELSHAAGLSGVGVIAEVVHDDGSMMRFDALRAFATEHNLPMISIEDLIKYVAKA